jgi:hypothetical protein
MDWMSDMERLTASENRILLPKTGSTFYHDIEHMMRQSLTDQRFSVS